MPVAVKFTATPKAVEGLVGVIAIDTNSAALTVNVPDVLLSLLLIPLRLAEMAVVPGVNAVNSPFDSGLVIDVSLVFQVTEVVMF